MISSIRAFVRRIAFWVADRFEWAFDDVPPLPEPVVWNRDAGVHGARALSSLEPLADVRAIVDSAQAEPPTPTPAPAPPATLHVRHEHSCEVCGDAASGVWMPTFGCRGCRPHGDLELWMCGVCFWVRRMRTGVRRS